MTRKVDVETVDAVRRRLAVEVPAEEVSAELEKAYAEFGRAARVRGFRPGRVPRHVLERMFGDRVRAEVFGRLIQHSYADALEECQIEVVGAPEIVTELAEPGAPLRYSATIEVMPHVVVQGYDGLRAERAVAPVLDADVDAFVERLRQSYAQLQPLPQDTAAESGQVVALDYEARVDGRLVGRGESREIELGASPFPREFDQQVSGARAGAEREFSLDYPADHPVAELAGKTVRFRVRLRGVFRKEVPELDDEFAKDHGECSTLNELRARVRTQLEADAAGQADDAVRRSLIDQLSRATDVPLPRALVERRVEALVEEVLQSWQQRRIRPPSDTVARMRLREELEPQARQQVKVSLLLDAIVRQEGITVSDAEVDARIAALATQAGSAADRVRALYQHEEARRQLRMRMLHAAAIDVVAGRATITSVERPRGVAEVRENG